MAVKIFIATDRLDSVLEKLSTKIDLWIPALLKDDKSGPTGFVPYEPGKAVAFDRQTTMSLKKVLFSLPFFFLSSAAFAVSKTLI